MGHRAGDNGDGLTKSRPKLELSPVPHYDVVDECYTHERATKKEGLISHIIKRNRTEKHVRVSGVNDQTAGPMRLIF